MLPSAEPQAARPWWGEVVEGWVGNPGVLLPAPLCWLLGQTAGEGGLGLLGDLSVLEVTSSPACNPQELREMINLPGARPVLSPADFTGLENAVKGEGSVPCSSGRGLTSAGEHPRVIVRCSECASEKLLPCP